MQGSLEAIKSRYGVLSFDKTFKVKADPTRGEIEADPRFKYDPDFLKTEVLPAFLNKVLNALVALMSDGIDYAATEAAMAAIQAENSHLFQFSQDTGLNYSPDGILTASDIWTRLETWYQDNGTLVYETASNDKLKAVWFDQPKRGDHNVKGANQVLARIQGLFPKVTRTTIYSATAKKSVPALKGIGFVTTRPSSDPVPTQYPPQKTVTQQDGRPTRPSFSDFEQNQKILEETETDIGNLADNFVPKTVEPAQTGSGGSESLDINVSIGGTGAETGSGDAKTGSGGIEIPIAPPEPETPPTVPSIAPPESIAENIPDSTNPSQNNCQPTKSVEFAEQIRKAIANFDRSLAIQVTRALKDKTELRKEVRATLTVDEFDNFRLLVTAGFIKGTRVKYIGTRYHNQLQDLELVVNAIDGRSEISCTKPDGGYTTWLKPEDLETIS
jgi:hypothetical protein